MHVSGEAGESERVGRVKDENVDVWAVIFVEMVEGVFFVYVVGGVSQFSERLDVGWVVFPVLPLQTLDGVFFDEISEFAKLRSGEFYVDIVIPGHESFVPYSAEDGSGAKGISDVMLFAVCIDFFEH